MPLLQELRSRTRGAHDDLEARLDVPSRAADADAYAVLLASFRSLYAPLERSLGAWPGTADVVPDWPLRRKTAWLDADLAALGRAPLPDAVVAPVRCAEDVVGTLYVLEGATLGGAVLVRTLDDALPRRFFTSYGPDRGARWHAFRQRVAALEDGLRTDDVVAAASRTFALFGATAQERAA